MAITIKDVEQGSDNAGAVTLATTNFATNPATGDGIVVFVSGWNGGTPSGDSMADSWSTSYTRIGTFMGTSNSEWFTAFYAKNVTNAGNTAGHVTYTQPTVNKFTGLTVIAWLVSGVDTTTFYNADTNQNNPASATVSTFTTNTSTGTPTANSIAIGGMTDDIALTIANGVGWNTTGSNGFTTAMNTASRQTTGTTSFQDCYTEYKITSAGVAATWTQTGSTDVYAARIATFAPTATVSDTQEWRGSYPTPRRASVNLGY